MGGQCSREVFTITDIKSDKIHASPIYSTRVAAEKHLIPGQQVESRFAIRHWLTGEQALVPIEDEYVYKKIIAPDGRFFSTDRS